MKIIILILLFLAPATFADEDDKNFSIELEAGIVGQTFNDIQIPNDSSGTRFALNDVIGNGTFYSWRFSANWQITGRQELRLVLAPFRAEENGRLDKPVWYDGTPFLPGKVKASYKFNTYRLTYRYAFRVTEKWKLKIGFTSLIRDADVALEQDGTRANYDNLGFVPLLNFYLEYKINDRFLFLFDFNGLAGGPGRLLEGDFRLQYDITDKIFLGTGFRVLEGGVDVESVYNFALFYTGYVSIGYRF